MKTQGVSDQEKSLGLQDDADQLVTLGEFLEEIYKTFVSNSWNIVAAHFHTLHV